MATEWFKPRRYRHFDRPVCTEFAAKVQDPKFVASHSFSPLIRYLKIEKRYRKDQKKTIEKERPIMYASHRDACILSWYASVLNAKLETFYHENGLRDCVIAYRKLEKGNYDFASEANAFASANSPVYILAFDVTKFFDNLDHKLLKLRLKAVLGVSELSEDWYKVFRAITRYHYVALTELSAHPEFGERMQRRDRRPIATIAELKSARIKFHPNSTAGVGIPQGTPISAVLSNLYMIEFDREMQAYAIASGGFYRRYSDDILFICRAGRAPEVQAKVEELISRERLSLNDTKTERHLFDLSCDLKAERRAAQYLGFTFGVDGVGIRASSLSRQWRKMRRAIKRIGKVAEAAIAAGRSNKVHTKRLRRRFTAVPVRNFPSYARRSAGAFQNSSRIRQQLRKFERAAEREIQSLESIRS